MTFSILVDIFYPSVGTIFSKESVINSHAILHQRCVAAWAD